LIGYGEYLRESSAGRFLTAGKATVITTAIFFAGLIIIQQS
jgi:hypothetical protein